MADIIIIAVVAVLVGTAGMYIRKQKKRGVRCVGCSAGGQCSCMSEGGSSGDCGCNCHTDTNEES
ncbi:MAG: FeoB-associated Cys-rich membrane protein [Lachnospiraceae bacterium]|nr:FeoB-associated Cys-rich membrane protein [Lachnospiraceae bacterium]